jgi:eukaryotic-like serine/threonine-protein kinase
MLGYELLIGTVPFTAQTERALIAEHVLSAVPSIDERRKGIPAELGSLVMRLLAKNADERPANIHEVVQRLRSLQTA